MFPKSSKATWDKLKVRNSLQLRIMFAFTGIGDRYSCCDRVERLRASDREETLTDVWHICRTIVRTQSLCLFLG